MMFFVDGKTFINDMWIFYVIHYVGIFIFILRYLKRKKASLQILFSPIFFSFLYLGLSFTLGAIFIPLNYGWSKEVYDNFVGIHKLHQFTIYFFIVDMLLLYYWLKIVNKNMPKIPPLKKIKWMDFNPIVFFSFWIFFILLNFVPAFEKLLLGFAYPLKLVTIIYIVLQSFKFSWKLRVFEYLILIAIIFSHHYNSKREVLLVIFIFMFLESIYNRFQIKFKFKFVLKIFLAVVIGAYLVLAASIMRGYGMYQLDSKFDAFLKVPEYINQPYFKHAFVENFEVNTVLGNTMICMNFVEEEKLPLQYGGTYLKILFSPIPRSIWKNKPEGMILKYTYTLNPEHKKKGQSLPVVHYAEGFANFYWLGIFVVVAILVFFEKMFWYVVTCDNMNILNGKLVFYTYIICILFQYIRGSGFDLFLLYSIVPIPFIIIISLLPTSNGRKEKSTYSIQ